MPFTEDLKNALLQLNIKPNYDDLEGTSNAIKAQLASYHPDKTGGTFETEEQRQNYQHIQEVLAKFERERKIATQMIPLHQVSDLVGAIMQSQVTASELKHKQEAELAKERFQRQIKRKYFFPKITAATIASLCLILIAFLGNFKSNPYYRIAANYYAQDDKIKIINEVNGLGAELKMSEFYKFGGRPNTKADSFKDDADIFLLRVFEDGFNGRIPQDANYDSIHWFRVVYSPLNAPDSERRLTLEYQCLRVSQLLERATIINDIDLFSPTESLLFNSLERGNIKLEKGISSASAIISAAKSDRQTRQEILVNNPLLGEASLNMSLNELSSLLPTLQPSVRDFNERIIDFREGVIKSKGKAIEKADGKILWRLTTVTICACVMFIIAWMKERSDEKWLEYVSNDEGLEAVFTKLCANKDIMARSPHKFSSSEFAKELRQKDVPKILIPLFGKEVSGAQSNQIASVLLDRLKDRKVIEEIASPSIQPWYEVKIIDT